MESLINIRYFKEVVPEPCFIGSRCRIVPAATAWTVTTVLKVKRAANGNDNLEFLSPAVLTVQNFRFLSSCLCIVPECDRHCYR